MTAHDENGPREVGEEELGEVAGGGIDPLPIQLPGNPGGPMHPGQFPVDPPFGVGTGPMEPGGVTLPIIIER